VGALATRGSQYWGVLMQVILVPLAKVGGVGIEGGGFGFLGGYLSTFARVISSGISASSFTEVVRFFGVHGGVKWFRSWR